ncbi:MAG: hypothetical protein JWL88_802 [Parcubacteria group bacterium]|nr:hypothetical protein [Parcubacteria group bacterium]
MCSLNDNYPPLPIGVGVFYRRTSEPFKPGLRHVFELALYGREHPIPVPGEVPLAIRLRKRFGKRNIGIIKNDAAATVIRILSEPLTRACGKLHIATMIARIAYQHYGSIVPVSIIEAEASICGNRFPAFLAA